MNIWKTEVTLEMVQKRASHSMSDYLGIEFIEIGEDFLKACMPVNERTKQPSGIMHGGASCVLAETVGSTAAQYCVDLEKYYCVGLDINTNHVRSIKDGLVIAKAKPYHLGRTTQVWGIEIVNKEDQLISINRLTMAILSRS